MALNISADATSSSSEQPPLKVAMSSLASNFNAITLYCAAGLLVLSGCTQTVGIIPEPLITAPRAAPLVSKADADATLASATAARGGLQVTPTPPLPAEFGMRVKCRTKMPPIPTVPWRAGCPRCIA